MSHLLPNKDPVATLCCLHRVPSHIRTDWFWHPSQHIHNAVLLLGGFGSLLSRNTLSTRTFPWTLGTTSIQDCDTLKTRFPTQEFAHKPIDFDKDTKCANTIQENNSRVKYVLTTNTHGDWAELHQHLSVLGTTKDGSVSSRVGISSLYRTKDERSRCTP